MDELELWNLVIACNTCGLHSLMEDMHLVPDKGKLVCKKCSLSEETQVIAMCDISNDEDEW